MKTSVITSPNECVQQLSAQDDKQYILSVVAKRTYFIDGAGTLVDLDRQVPLATDLVVSELDHNLLEQDLDLIPLKPRTDVVIKGHAYSGGSPQGVVASVRVGTHRKDIVVVGDRRCTLSPTGAVVISPAEPFDRMPLTFARAYGGRDKVAEAKYGNPAAVFAPYLASSHLRAENLSPYLYPRNPCGRGYVIEATKEAMEQCEMPNLEDPLDMITPSRILVGRHDRWEQMPIPQGLGWIHWGWFPRSALGGIRLSRARESKLVTEVARGLLPQSVLDAPDPRGFPRETSLRFFNGAPLDLQLPVLAGDEVVELVHMHKLQKSWQFRLPGGPRRICTDGRGGKLNRTKPILQTVVIEPDTSLVSLVWRGSAPALRPYFPEERARMPLLVEW